MKKRRKKEEKRDGRKENGQLHSNQMAAECPLLVHHQHALGPGIALTVLIGAGCEYLVRVPSFKPSRERVARFLEVLEQGAVFLGFLKE